MRQGLFHHSAGGSAVKGKEEVGDIPLPRDQFYEGVVVGELDSYVHAHIDDRGILSAQINLQSEHYHIEVSQPCVCARVRDACALLWAEWDGEQWTVVSNY